MLLLLFLATTATAGDVMSSAQDAIKARLRDPQSAIFSEMRQIGGKDHAGEYTGVCGSVNAKNLFGRYVGKTPFLYLVRNDKGFGLIASNYEIETTPDYAFTLRIHQRFCGE